VSTPTGCGRSFADESICSCCPLDGMILYNQVKPDFYYKLPK
jgi:hypothetical protein